MLRGNGGTGYIRVDWFTPKGLNTWGDGRLTILGTDGFIEIRKNVDIAGREGGSHLFLVDQKETRYVDCKDVALPFGRQADRRRPATAPRRRCRRSTRSWRCSWRSKPKPTRIELTPGDGAGRHAVVAGLTPRR